MTPDERRQRIEAAAKAFYDPADSENWVAPVQLIRNMERAIDAADSVVQKKKDNWTLEKDFDIIVHLEWEEPISLETKHIEGLRKTLEMRAEEYFAFLDEDYYQGGYANVVASSEVPCE